MQLAIDDSSLFDYVSEGVINKKYPHSFMYLIDDNNNSVISMKVLYSQEYHFFIEIINHLFQAGTRKNNRY